MFWFPSLINGRPKCHLIGLALFPKTVDRGMAFLLSLPLMLLRDLDLEPTLLPATVVVGGIVH